MNLTKDISQEADLKTGQIKAILYLLQTTIDQVKTDIDSSYELLRIGEITPLSKMIEDSLSDPISGMFGALYTLDEQVKEIIANLVTKYLKSLKPTVELKAFMRVDNSSSLYFAIVLKTDNITNRSKVFDFFDSYDRLEISQRYPVSFQFVPSTLTDKVSHLTALSLD